MCIQTAGIYSWLVCASARTRRTRFQVCPMRHVCMTGHAVELVEMARQGEYYVVGVRPLACDRVAHRGVRGEWGLIHHGRAERRIW
jgi:hypothetical protein